MPAWLLTPLARYLSIAVLAGGLFAAGWTVRGWREGSNTVSAVIKRDVEVDKIEAVDKSDVKEQDDGDDQKVTQLQRDLDAALAELAGLRQRPRGPMPRPQDNAAARVPNCPEPEPARSSEAADRAMEEESLRAGALAETFRLQVLSCQAQWPR